MVIPHVSLLDSRASIRITIKMKHLLGTIVLTPWVLLWAGCLGTTSEASFIGGREVDLCNGVWNVCKGHTAGCILDESHYVKNDKAASL